MMSQQSKCIGSSDWDVDFAQSHPFFKYLPCFEGSKSLKAASHSHYQRQQMHQLVIVCTIAGFSAIQFPGGIGGIGVNMASPTTLT